MIIHPEDEDRERVKEAGERLKEVDLRKREGHRHEYSEVFTNIRHYSALRFAVFTVFVAATGALIGATLNTPRHAVIVMSLKILGATLAAVILNFETHIDGFLLHLNKRAMQLEAALDYEQTRSLKISKWRWRTGRLVSITALYIVTLLFWVLWLIVP